MEGNGASRYCLYLETITGNKYYFDVESGLFVQMVDGSKASKASLPSLDFLTANFINKEELASSYGIDDVVSKVYISYNFQGEKLLAPVFNNSRWAHVATTYGKGAKVDMSDKENLNLYNEIYTEIASLDSAFSDFLLKNEKRLIHLSPRTTNTIVALRAHERAIAMKKTYGFGSTNFDTIQKVNDIYYEDRYGFYQDLKKRLSNYRELRTVYLNYCRFTNKTNTPVLSESEKPKKKVVVPPQQLSMFD